MIVFFRVIITLIAGVKSMFKKDNKGLDIVALAGVNQKFNSKRLEFDDERSAWFFVVFTCRTNHYKLSLRKPLSKNIYQQIRGIISPKAMSSKELYRAIGYHVNSIKYLSNMKANTKRWNLWGRPDGIVSATESSKAQETLVLRHPEYMAAKRLSRRGGVQKRIIVNTGNSGKKR